MSKKEYKIGLVLAVVMFLVLVSLSQTGNAAALNGDTTPTCCDFDFDGNGVIDVADIMAVASRWRCQIGDECYDERYDLDKDGDIDVVDIMHVSACWGETCSTVTPTVTATPSSTPTNTSTLTLTPTSTPTPTLTPTPTSASSDTESPEILEFGVELTPTDPVAAKITWQVSDFGGSYLDRVEIWRCPQIGTWSVIYTFPVVYDSTFFTGTFYDIPGNGFWWYKIRVYDRAGNYAESLPEWIIVETSTPTPTPTSTATATATATATTTTTATATATPASPDNTAPAITKFTLNLEGVSNVRICWKVFDEGGSHLNYARIWRANFTGIWQQVGPDYYYAPNTDGPIEVCVIDSPGSGTWWYKVDVADNAGNVVHWGDLSITVEGPTPTSTSTTTPTRISSDNIAPVISMFSVEPEGENALICWNASDQGGSHLNYTRIWINDSYGFYYYDPYTDGPIELCILEDAPNQGTWLYKVDVVDNAGNMTQSPIISITAGTITPTSTPTRTPTRTPTSGPTPTHTPTRTPGPGDNTAPTVTEFKVEPRISNGWVKISWSAYDQGGSHLSHAEIWRAPDVGGSPGTWRKIGPNYYAPNGSDGPWYGSVSDDPAEGTWWYNIHVLDNNGNVGQGCASPASGSHFPSAQQLQALPICAATIVDKTGPNIVSFWVDPYRNVSSAYLTFHWFATDTAGAGLGQAEIWRTSDPPDLDDREWEQVAIKQAPLWTFWWTDSIQVYRPTGGLWWYGLHITDLAGNYGVEPELVPIIMPFLEPPVRGSTSAVALTGNFTGTCGTVGRINAWFDHQCPNLTHDDYIYKWNGDHLYAPIDQIGQRGIDWYDGHDGVDFCNLCAEENVYAASDGEVVDVGWTSNGGNYVVIDHGNHFATYYGHLASVKVPEGNSVSSSTVIGIMGSTGSSATGVHLHFGLFYDRDADENYFLDERNDDDTPDYPEESVDPFGWLPTTTGIVDPDEKPDPWIGAGGSRSYYFWYETSPIYNQMSSSGVTARTPKIYLPLMLKG